MAEYALTELQREVLLIFFDLPESSGFVLAGGAALVASGLSERPTKDVDLFGSDLTVGVAGASDALEAACVGRGWTVERIQDSPSFRRPSSRAAEFLVPLFEQLPIRARSPLSGQLNQISVEPLEGVAQSRPVLLGEDLLPHFDRVVGTNRHE